MGNPAEMLLFDSGAWTLLDLGFWPIQSYCILLKGTSGSR